MSVVNEDLEIIAKLAALLDPSAVAAEVSLLVGARLRSAQLGTVGKSADTPLPLPDALDRKVRHQYETYRKQIAQARALLVRASVVQEELLFRMTLEQAQKAVEEERDGVTCANPACSTVIVPPARVLGGRCRACHEFKRDHDGTERSRDLCQK